MAREQPLTKRERRVERLFEIPMAVLTLLLIPVLAYPYLLPVDDDVQLLLQGTSFLIWIAFYAEFFVKLVVARNMKSALKRNWFLIVILLSPLLLSFRLLRFARFVSLVRILRLQSLVDKMTSTLKRLIYNLEYVALAFGAFTIAAALLVWRVEETAGGEITTLPEALWWAVITVTTIGYGDVVPTTSTGKVIGAFAAFFGVLIFMIFTARLTALFVSTGADKQSK